MKREIKFRGMSPLKNWFYGTPCKSNYGIELITEVYHIDGAEWNITGQDVIPETVTQFTGLHDKNGREIYEGDILERFAIVQKGVNPRKRSVVEWNLYHWDGINQWMQSEVIGNIFENPELLS